MNRRLKTALLLITVLVLGVLGFALFYSLALAQPKYHGKELPEWMESLLSHRPAERAEASKAVQHLGKRCVPIIVVYLGPQPPSWSSKLRQYLLNQTVIKLRSPVVKGVIDQDRRRLSALAACEVLGSAAQGALPALEQALYTNRDFYVAYAMACIGPKATGPLTRAASSKDYFISASALYFLDLLTGTPGRLEPEDFDRSFSERARDQERKMIVYWLPERFTWATTNYLGNRANATQAATAERYSIH